MPGAGATHSLYVPKRTGDTSVTICPSAVSLSDVSVSCAGAVVHTDGDGSTSIVNIGGTDYWLVTGLTGTGGVSGGDSDAGAPTGGTTDNNDGLADTGDNTRPLLITAAGLILIGSGAFATLLKNRQRI